MISNRALGVPQNLGVSAQGVPQRSGLGPREYHKDRE